MNRIASLLAAVLLAGCSSLPQDASTRLTTVASAYAVVQAAGNVYAALPMCSATSGPVCSQPAVVAEIVKAKRVADVALEQLQAAIVAGDSNRYAAALVAALGAIALYEQVLSTYGLSKSPTG